MFFEIKKRILSLQDRHFSRRQMNETIFMEIEVKADFMYLSGYTPYIFKCGLHFFRISLGIYFEFYVCLFRLIFESIIVHVERNLDDTDVVIFQRSHRGWRNTDSNNQNRPARTTHLGSISKYNIRLRNM